MIAGEISVFPLTPIRPVFRHPCHSVPDFANKQQTIIHLLREMLEQQLPILVRVIELVELALRVTSPPSHDKDVVGNNRPEKNNRDGMLSITSRSHAHRATLVLPLVQRHEVVRVAVRLPAGVGRHMVRLSRKAPSPRQAIRPRLRLRLTLPPSAHHCLQRRQTHLALRGVDRDIEGLQCHAAQNKPVLLCLTPPPRTHAQRVVQALVHVTAVQHAQTASHPPPSHSLVAALTAEHQLLQRQADAPLVPVDAELKRGEGVLLPVLSVIPPCCAHLAQPAQVLLRV